MIIAGIDEAGLGPKLGPLIVASAAFKIDDPCEAQEVSLWDIFSKTTTRNKSHKDHRLLVTDSKIAYNSRGLPALQNVVLNFLYALTGHKPAINIYDLISRLGAESMIPQITQSKWFSQITTENVAPEFFLNPEATFNLRHKQAKIQHLRCRILTARMLNKLFADGLNKSEVLLLQTGQHIRHIVDTYTDPQIRIVVDKQGGKTYYAPYLTDILDGRWVETIKESSNSSVYRIEDSIYIEFRPKADQNEFTVALASITAKFLREILMHEFNTYFTSKISKLKATAGYPLDAKRFYAEITEFLQKDRIETHEIWRER